MIFFSFFLFTDDLQYTVQLMRSIIQVWSSFNFALIQQQNYYFCYNFKKRFPYKSFYNHLFVCCNVTIYDQSFFNVVVCMCLCVLCARWSLSTYRILSLGSLKLSCIISSVNFFFSNFQVSFSKNFILLTLFHFQEVFLTGRF